MGGQVGTIFEVTITGENIDPVEQLLFSSSEVKADAKRNEAGDVIPNQFVVNLPPGLADGLLEARVVSRLGISSARVFTVGTLPETVQSTASPQIDQPFKLELNTVCNAVIGDRQINHYQFEARAGERIIVDCSARGIDSKLNPVLVLANAKGQDLVAERRGGVIEFSVPDNGSYLVKVHDLTFKGGPAYFYRLILRSLAEGEVYARPDATADVAAYSWPPSLLNAMDAIGEIENANAEEAQAITLPVHIRGAFAQAADVDRFEFDAKQGEHWWIEVASQRLGRPTDPFVLVQRLDDANPAQMTDVVELNDIASPVKVSSNAYAYDGPPYNAGSADVLGELIIPEDGRYQLQLNDLFGGTRQDPNNIYELVIRAAQPDFAIAAWAMHRELRNGDRNALSKPLALRAGATVALEVVVFRRDGFAGTIELELKDLPEGVTATGLTMGPGQTSGFILLTASEQAMRAVGVARLVGVSEINGERVERTGQLASMAWPVRDHWQEIPNPRLLRDIWVSVTDVEPSTITITPEYSNDSPDRFRVKEGETLLVPLNITRRCEFSGANVSLATLGAGFDRNPKFDLPLQADRHEVTLDLAKLKTPPGLYRIAFYGSAVAKYRDNVQAITLAEDNLRRASAKREEQERSLAKCREDANSLDAADKTERETTCQRLSEQLAATMKEVERLEQIVKAAMKNAEPKDIADIIVTEPITIEILPAKDVK